MVIRRMDGSNTVITYDYDNNARLESIDTGDGVIDMEYQDFATGGYFGDSHFNSFGLGLGPRLRGRGIRPIRRSSPSGNDESLGGRPVGVWRRIRSSFSRPIGHGPGHSPQD